MNLKPNLWTLLFLIAAAALAYVKYVDSSIIKPTAPTIVIPPKASNNLGRVYDYSALEKDSFILYQNNYKQRYLPVVNDSTLNLKDVVGVDTLGVLAYSMLEHEFEHMYQEYKSSEVGDKKPEVYIYPIIKDTIINGMKHGMMELAFLIKSSSGDKEGFFNFTHPCPPICGDGIPYTDIADLIPQN